MSQSSQTITSYNLMTFAPKSSGSLNHEQIASLYSKCIELSEQNKINQKNTWSLDLIPYIQQVLTDPKLIENSSGINYAKLGSTIGASIKIYSTRVDSAHSLTHQVHSSLFSNSNKRKRRNGDNTNDTSDTSHRTIRSTFRRQSTISSNTTDLNMPIDESTATQQNFLDSFFTLQSQAYEDGNPASLFMNMLDFGTNDLLLLSSDDLLFHRDNKEEIPNQKVSLENVTNTMDEQNEQQSEPLDEVSFNDTEDIDFADMNGDHRDDTQAEFERSMGEPLEELAHELLMDDTFEASDSPYTPGEVGFNDSAPGFERQSTMPINYPNPNDNGNPILDTGSGYGAILRQSSTIDSNLRWMIDPTGSTSGSFDELVNLLSDLVGPCRVPTLNQNRTIGATFTHDKENYDSNQDDILENHSTLKKNNSTQSTAPLKRKTSKNTSKTNKGSEHYDFSKFDIHSKPSFNIPTRDSNVVAKRKCEPEKYLLKERGSFSIRNFGTLFLRPQFQVKLASMRNNSTRISDNLFNQNGAFGSDNQDESGADPSYSMYDMNVDDTDDIPNSPGFKNLSPFDPTELAHALLDLDDDDDAEEDIIFDPLALEGSNQAAKLASQMESTKNLILETLTDIIEDATVPAPKKKTRNKSSTSKENSNSNELKTKAFDSMLLNIRENNIDESSKNISLSLYFMALLHIANEECLEITSNENLDNLLVSKYTGL